MMKKKFNVGGMTCAACQSHVEKAIKDLDGIENVNVDSEITADLVGDYLFTDEKFVKSLSTQKPTVFQKIKSLIA